MSKTLAIIFNYNDKGMTERLYESLLPASTEDYDLFILDNGSRREEIATNTSVRLETNVYFGGAMNAAFKVYLHNKDKYDSMLMLNNDIFVGRNFIPSLRDRLFEGDFKSVAPSVIQPEKAQCYWEHMLNWGAKETREARWLDNYCTMFHGDLIEEMKGFSETLIFGWGIDIYTGYVCSQKGWKLGVVDTNTIIHLGAHTYRDGRAHITLSEYEQNAFNGMNRFFAENGITHVLDEFRNWGRTYRYEGETK